MLQYCVFFFIAQCCYNKLKKGQQFLVLFPLQYQLSLVTPQELFTLHFHSFNHWKQTVILLSPSPSSFLSNIAAFHFTSWHFYVLLHDLYGIKTILYWKWGSVEEKTWFSCISIVFRCTLKVQPQYISAEASPNSRWIQLRSRFISGSASSLWRIFSFSSICLRHAANHVKSDRNGGTLYYFTLF